MSNPKPKDMSGKLGTFYGEIIKEDKPFDFRLLQPELVATLHACCPYGQVNPQWDDKFHTEVWRVFKHCGLENVFTDLGRPMENRVGKQVGVTFYIQFTNLPDDLRERLLAALPDDLGYGETCGICDKETDHPRLASAFLSMVALHFGYAYRSAYGLSSYQRREEEERRTRQNYTASAHGSPHFPLLALESSFGFLPVPPKKL